MGPWKFHKTCAVRRWHVRTSFVLSRLYCPSYKEKESIMEEESKTFEQGLSISGLRYLYHVSVMFKNICINLEFYS